MSRSDPKRVLVAEDEYIICQSILAELADLGHTIVGTARDGEEAVALTRDLKPDLVLMDIHMPRLDGLAAARRIQEEQPTPIVILTAYESRELLQEASGAGVSAYLTKPPFAAELERAIVIALARHDDLLALRRASRQIEEKNALLHALNSELEQRNLELQKAVDEIQTLQGILPFCSYCKKIRDDDGYWERVDLYITQHTPARVSHGICPDCCREHFPDEFPDL